MPIIEADPYLDDHPSKWIITMVIVVVPPKDRVVPGVTTVAETLH